MILALFSNILYPPIFKNKENEWNENDRQECVEMLSRAILNEKGTFVITRYFRPLLLELLGRIIHRNVMQLRNEEYENLVVCVAKLTNLASPLLFDMAMELFEKSPFFLDRIIVSGEYLRESHKMAEMLKASRYLLSHSQRIKDVWNWSPLLNIVSLVKEERVSAELQRVLSLVFNVQDTNKKQKHIDEELIE